MVDGLDVGLTVEKKVENVRFVMKMDLKVFVAVEIISAMVIVKIQL